MTVSISSGGIKPLASPGHNTVLLGSNVNGIVDARQRSTFMTMYALQYDFSFALTTAMASSRVDPEQK